MPLRKIYWKYLRMILLQYEETDWRFIKRIAGHFGLVVTPSIVKEGVIYHVGKVHHLTHTLPGDIKYSAKKQIDEFMMQASNEEGSNNAGILFVKLI